MPEYGICPDCKEHCDWEEEDELTDEEQKELDMLKAANDAEYNNQKIKVMNKEFIPYEQALELKELGFLTYKKDNDSGVLYKGDDIPSILYQQAFRWFREKYDFTYSIGKTNIAVVHYGPTTQLLQDNDSYEAAELAAIKWFIDAAKQL
jgi:hypothetical protein